MIKDPFITGLNRPRGLAVLGNILYVSNGGSGTVGKYDATTGAVINANFITGLSHPTALALLGNTLFVADTHAIINGTGTIGKYDATTGKVINASFITGVTPYGLAVTSAK